MTDWKNMELWYIDYYLLVIEGKDTQEIILLPGHKF